MRIKLSKLALEELNHKLHIVCGETDLQDSYGVTQREADELYMKFYRAKPGFYEVTANEAVVIKGELEDSANNSYGNLVRVYSHVVSQIRHGGAFEHQTRRAKAREARQPRKYPLPKRPRGKKGRAYPVNGVVEDKCEFVALAAKMLIERYENNTRAQRRDPVKITDRKIHYFAVNQNRGHAYNNRGGMRIVTIPMLVINSQKPGYFTYYVAHELAHHYAHFKHNSSGHGEMFMYWLKQLCPPEFQHYELGYKPKFARAAGIRRAIGEAA